MKVGDIVLYQGCEVVILNEIIHDTCIIQVKDTLYQFWVDSKLLEYKK